MFNRFSLGDELGLAESLGNVEGSKRRALNVRTNVNNIGVLPASKMPVNTCPIKLIIRRKTNPSNRSLSPQSSYPPTIMQSRPQALTARPMLKLTTANSVTGPQRPTTGTPVYVSPANSLMTKASSLPLGVPAFRPLPKPEPEPVSYVPTLVPKTFSLKTPQTPDLSFQNQLMNQTSSFHRPSRITSAPPNHHIVYKDSSIQVQKVPAFQAMPESVSRISTGPVIQIDNKLSHEPTIKNSIVTVPSRHDVIGKGTTVVDGVDLMGHTVEELAAAANVSVEVIKEAIRVRKQEILAQQQYQKQQAAIVHAQVMAAQQATSTSTTTTTTTTTTPRPRRYPTHSGHKVMNAPKEYYPVGYDKNFDDNFTSKVDLPYTTFNCGEQKHFPGLYGDEDLGCMVFHVCALTDDGLIMKSFLCPESTLFDQTILKCNWWFYVDCKNSKTLYDSNLPVSKSYQLMKALSFFSANYKSPGQNADGVDVEALKNSVNGGNSTVSGRSASGGGVVEIDGKSSSSVQQSTSTTTKNSAKA
ncbi:chitin binding protein [Culex quinquefasciatus]|uniref:Chitin binding protein n=1 Tax=Culex quinquefasciatus TaxID=7176 RepID=B0WJ01_CULQU|nr:chitin binding protein [Culex quinquefasciatus]|eukprot:XP_001848685.1 chitin binding protein [Culex quinquefasciatus]